MSKTLELKGAYGKGKDCKVWITQVFVKNLV